MNLIDEMMKDLEVGSHAMKSQMNSISEIMDKSNKILLKMKTVRSGKNNSNKQRSNLVKVEFTAASMLALAKIIRFSKQCAALTNENGVSFEEYLKCQKERLDFLGGAVRELLAIGEATTFMKANLVSIANTCYDENSNDDSLTSE
ncbi:uncharacterized protein LOC119672984 [Teleopsis dalmanni]|uniref:uncharacterized protein LOC119672984 n=1 Tax=Teleopsis dalmanni TaxID=139649 RepID=UPI0018CE8F10|nr:uncharacterized protein LOC119672984 [Teleopsis dalmanni]XP_037940101.1 uncharacterized protein LOC119672984 [Teleopsis dalmanni]